MEGKGAVWEHGGKYGALALDAPCQTFGPAARDNSGRLGSASVPFKICHGCIPLRNLIVYGKMRKWEANGSPL